MSFSSPKTQNIKARADDGKEAITRRIDSGNGGEGGIRTHGTLRYNGFRDRPIRPLWHLSGTLFDDIRDTEHCSVILNQKKR